MLQFTKAAVTSSVAAAMALMAAESAAQPIQLLADLRPGMIQSDRRRIVQAVETTETLYYISEATEDPSGSGGGTLFLNSTNGSLQNLHIGHEIGDIRNFGNGRYAPGSYPFYAVVNGKAVFYGSETGRHSAFYELDGHEAEPRRLTAVEELAFVSAIWVGHNDKICFLKTRVSTPGLEIGYLSAGTESGMDVTTTVSQADLRSSWIGDARVVGNRIVFSLVEDNAAKVRIYSSDGTATGTQLLLDLSSADYLDTVFVPALGKCFIGVADNAKGLRPLYVTDGTLTGTSLLDPHLAEPFQMESNSATAESATDLYWIGQGGGNVFFSNGVSTGLLPKQEWPQLTYDSVAWIGDSLYISAHSFNDFNSRYILQSDGRTTPTSVSSAESPMAEIWEECKTSSGSLVYSGSGVYFVRESLSDAILLAEPGAGERPNLPNVWSFKGRAVYNQFMPDSLTEQLWISTPANASNPFQLTAFTSTPASSNPAHFEPAGSLLFFYQTISLIGGWSSDFYRTDGTPGGTEELLPAEPVFLGPTDTGMLFYHRSEYGDGVYWGDGKVYLADGSGGIPVELADASTTYPEQPPNRLFNIGETCFIGGVGSMGEARLIKSDGTISGTQEMLLGPDFSLQYPLHPVGLAGNHGVFCGPNAAPESGYQVWSTDGTDAGTQKIAELPSKPTQGAGLPDGNVIFGAQDEIGVWWLYRSDGTASGTVKIKTDSRWKSLHHFVASGAGVYFLAGYSDPVYVQLWNTNGIETIGPVGLGWKILNDEHLQLVANKRNGVIAAGRTEYGSAIVHYNAALRHDIIYDGPTTDIPRVLAGEYEVYYTRVSAEHGREVWHASLVTDTRELVQDLAPGPASGLGTGDAGVIGNKLIFVADPHDGVTGREPHFIELSTGSAVGDWELY